MDILIGILVSAAILLVFYHLRKKGREVSNVVVGNPQPPNGPGVPGATCKEYLNNNGSAIAGVNYTDCSGNILSNQTIEPNQSICVQEGTLSGGDSGYLIELGNC